MNTGRRKLNMITIDGCVATIHVESKRHGHVEILIDASMVEKVCDYTWCVKKGHNGLYASTEAKKPDGGGAKLYIHHLIVGKPPTGYVTDHISRDALDNRSANLRIVTKQSNHFNTSARGYYWDKFHGKYQARIKFNGKRTFLGYYDTAEEARAAYNDAKPVHHVIVELGNETTTPAAQ